MTMTVDIDNDVKFAADNLFGSYGLDIDTAVKMYIYSAVKTNTLFPFMAVPNYKNDGLSGTECVGIYDCDEDEQTLEEAMRDALNGTNLYGPFDTAEEATSDMLKDHR
ncbi:MAG: hypothetical protein FWE23_04165 [Chitinivibrionia bacterium]|nr:hypothetical protein [Chitinivibrionia bacterium]